MQDARKPRVTAIVVSWNSRADTIACLESLATSSYPALDVIVVDNASSDGTAAEIRRRFPHAVLIESGENLGFSGGNNVGLEAALLRGCDYVLLLNPDTLVVQPDWIERLVGVGEARPDVGILGPHTTTELGVLCGGPVLLNWTLGQVERYAPMEDEVVSCDMVGGHAMLAKRAVLERAGLLDHLLFLFYEESDLSARARSAGFATVFVRGSRIVHKFGTSRAKVPYSTIYYSHRNRIRFLKKHCGLRALSYSLARDVWLAAIALVRRKPAGDAPPSEQDGDPHRAPSDDPRRLRRVRVRAWIDGIVGNYGRRTIP